jgi:hypothetical protein
MRSEGNSFAQLADLALAGRAPRSRALGPRRRGDLRRGRHGDPAGAAAGLIALGVTRVAIRSRSARALTGVPRPYGRVGLYSPAAPGAPCRVSAHAGDDPSRGPRFALSWPGLRSPARTAPGALTRRTERPPLRAGATPPHNALRSCHVTWLSTAWRPFPSAPRGALRSGDRPGPDVAKTKVVARERAPAMPSNHGVLR